MATAKEGEGTEEEEFDGTREGASKLALAGKPREPPGRLQTQL
jgi:hypothetical protein